MKIKKIAIVILVFCSCLLYAKGQKDYELDSGNLKIKVFGKTGNFCVYYASVRGKDNYLPLYDDRSYGRDNKFFVYHNGKTYELSKKLGKPVKIEQADGGFVLRYKFTDKFYVVQTISFTEQSYGTSGPLVKIETLIENTCGEPADIALKAVFDTHLGEYKRIPLYTDIRTGLFSETLLEPKFEKDSAIISSNSDVACMFLLSHSEASQPENVYIANWERLQSVKWLPPIVPGRSFSTRYFHNDSAILFVWPRSYLQNNEKQAITMFIGYYDYLRKNKVEEVVEKTEPVIESDNILPELADQEIAKDTAEKEDSSDMDLNFEKDESEMTEQELKDYRYIKALLDKIAEVEADPDKVSDEYIEDLTKQADDAINDIQE